MKRWIAILLAFSLCFALIPAAGASMPDSFFQTHSDWHFDLTKEPDRPMTLEEYIALARAYSFWSVGKADGTTPRDRDGDLPADWAAPYIREAAAFGIITPSKVDYSAPLTLGTAMEILVHCKGLYCYNAINMYDFTGADGLTADQLLCLDVAVDYGLLAYTPNLNVSTPLLRRDLESKYLIPTAEAKPVVGLKQRTLGYQYSMAFYQFNGNAKYDNAKKQLELFKQYSSQFNLLTLGATLPMKKNGSHYIDDLIDIYKQLYANDPELHPDPQLDLISFCKEKNIPVLGGVCVYYDPAGEAVIKELAQSDANLTAAVNELMDIVHKYGLDGLNLDIEISEYLAPNYRGFYSKFIRQLSQRLHAENLMLAVTIGAAKSDSDAEKMLYDYDVVSDVADLAVIINYDDHPARRYKQSVSSEYGAMSDYTYVARCARYAAAAIGADKVMISLGGFGVWYNITDHTQANINSGQGEGLARNLTMPEVYALRDQYHAAEKTNGDVVKDCYFTYEDGGKSYAVYYESPQGLADRTALALNYGLAGVAGFYLGGEHTQMFELMGKKMTDLPFNDLDPALWYMPGITYACQNGLMNGMSSSKFQPLSPMTRGQLVTVLWRNAGSQVGFTHSFTDVDRSKYYNDAIAWAANNDIVTGISTTSFKPTNNVTREQLVTILYRYAKKSGFDTSAAADLGTYPDANTVSSYALEAMRWGVGAGIINGKGSSSDATTLQPRGNASRAEVAAILMRFIENIMKA